MACYNLQRLHKDMLFLLQIVQGGGWARVPATFEVVLQTGGWIIVLDVLSYSGCLSAHLRAAVAPPSPRKNPQTSVCIMRRPTMGGAFFGRKTSV